jgi:hypothetical protein
MGYYHFRRDPDPTDEVIYERLCESFKDEIEPAVIAKYGPDDIVALREAFNNWTDGLCKDGEITDEMYDTMDNPY